MEGKEAPFDYERLVGVIRAELDLSLKPVTEALGRVEAAVEKTYSREVMDEKLKQRDDRIKLQGDEIKELKTLVGSFWSNALLKASSALGFVALLLELWRAFT